MNKYEKEVLRRRKPMLANMLDFSEESQEQYKEMGLLTDDMLAIIPVSDISKLIFSSRTYLEAIK